MRFRLRPIHAYLAIGVAAFCGGVNIIVHTLVPGFDPREIFMDANNLSRAGWYALGMYLSWQISRDYAAGSSGRLSWVLLAGSSFFGMLRHLFEFSSAHALRGNPEMADFTGFHQIPLSLSLILLIVSLVVMWVSFTGVGLGVKFHPADVLLAALLVVLIPPILVSMKNLSDARAPLGVVRWLQYTVPFLVAIAGALGVVLYRISADMGGGQFARFLRTLTVFLSIRMGALVLSTLPVLLADPIGRLASCMLWTSVDGIFVLALLYRREIRRYTDDVLRRYQADPHREITETVQYASRSNEML